MTSLGCLNKEDQCNLRKTQVLTYMEINLKGKHSASVCDEGKKLLEAKRKWKHGDKTVWRHGQFLDGLSMTPINLEAERQKSLLVQVELCPDIL